MDIDEAKKILSKVKFLDFKFKLTQRSSYSGTLWITSSAPDTRDRKQMINITRCIEICFDDRIPFIEIVYESILGALKHEASELFTVDGIDLFNEHHSEPEHNKNLDIIKTMFTREL